MREQMLAKARDLDDTLAAKREAEHRTEDARAGSNLQEARRYMKERLQKLPSGDPRRKPDIQKLRINTQIQGQIRSRLEK